MNHHECMPADTRELALGTQECMCADMSDSALGTVLSASECALGRRVACSLYRKKCFCCEMLAQLKELVQDLCSSPVEEEAMSGSSTAGTARELKGPDKPKQPPTPRTASRTRIRQRAHGDEQRGAMKREKDH